MFFFFGWTTTKIAVMRSTQYGGILTPLLDSLRMKNVLILPTLRTTKKHACLSPSQLYNIVYLLFTICLRWIQFLCFLAITNRKSTRTQNGPKLRAYSPKYHLSLRQSNKQHIDVKKASYLLVGATSGDISTKSFNQLNCSIRYTQILKEILLTIKFLIVKGEG